MSRSRDQAVQMETEGLPARDYSPLDAEINRAVLAVEEAKRALRVAQSRERVARLARARAEGL